MEKNSIDEKMKEAMLKCAYGYDYEEKEAIVDRAGRPEKVKIIKKHVPPNPLVMAQIRQLKEAGKW